MQWSRDCLESAPSHPLPDMVIAEPVPGGHNQDCTSSILGSLIPSYFLLPLGLQISHPGASLRVAHAHSFYGGQEPEVKEKQLE